VKVSTTLWAVKLRGRSFYKRPNGGPVTLNTKQIATVYAGSIERTTGVKAEAVRVRVRIEEIK
jgi:hypothetical protein